MMLALLLPAFPIATDRPTDGLKYAAGQATKPASRMARARLSRFSLPLSLRSDKSRLLAVPAFIVLDREHAVAARERAQRSEHGHRRKTLLTQAHQRQQGTDWKGGRGKPSHPCPSIPLKGDVSRHRLDQAQTLTQALHLGGRERCPFGRHMALLGQVL